MSGFTDSSRVPSQRPGLNLTLQWLCGLPIDQQYEPIVHALATPLRSSRHESRDCLAVKA